MAQSQHKSKKKASGGRLRTSRSKRKFELAGFPAQTKVSEKTVLRTKRIIGGNTKNRILAAHVVNVSDKKGKTQVVDIKNVLENPANHHLVRRNIITKGAVVDTKLGKVQITSRPGQEGTVNGKLL
jgi:small subunit ribosomal protein S8e